MFLSCWHTWTDTALPLPELTGSPAELCNVPGNEVKSRDRYLDLGSRVEWSAPLLRSALRAAWPSDRLSRLLPFVSGQETTGTTISWETQLTTHQIFFLADTSRQKIPVLTNVEVWTLNISPCLWLLVHHSLSQCLSISPWLRDPYLREPKTFPYRASDLTPGGLTFY